MQKNKGLDRRKVMQGGLALAAMPWGMKAIASASDKKLVVALATLGIETTLPQEGSIISNAYWAHMYDFMFENAEGGDVTPGLIEEWSLSDDHLTWTLAVRKGVKWHNGRELDAEDIAFNFGYWIIADDSIHSTTTLLRGAVTSAEAVGQHEVVVKLSRPVPALAHFLSRENSSAIVPREYGDMEDNVARENPIGTGPWRFAGRSLNEYIRFTAVSEHWREVPYYEELEIRNVPDTSARVAMIRNRSADIIDIPLTTKSQISDPELEVISTPNSVSAMLFFTGMYNDKAAKGYDETIPWRKQGVREALNMGINRKLIAERLFGEHASAAAVAFPLPGQLGYPQVDPYPYDPDAAKKLLIENGYPDGFEITLMSFKRPGLPDFPLLIQAVANDWSKLGLKVNLQNTEWGAVRGLQRNKELKGAVVPLTWGLSSPATLGHALGAPFYYYDMSPEVSEVNADILKAATIDELTEALSKTMTLLRAESGIIPLLYFDSLYVANKARAGGWQVEARYGGPDKFETARPA